MSKPPPRTGPLLLLDGMSLAFRAFFALPDTLAIADGTVTNAVHGFANMLQYLIGDHAPSALAVAFDLPGETFRDAMVEDYKGGRSDTPDHLLPQFELIRQVLESLAIPVVSAPGYEADDVLATLATQARDRGCDVVVVTGDRDAFQLVEDPHVKVLYNRRGVSDYSLYDHAGIVERTGLDPARYPMLAALRGDQSDNLPGVPGVGEKTAAKLLNTYGDIEGIYDNLDALTPKLRENLAEHRERVRSNYAVIPLIRDVPLETTIDQLTLGGWDFDTARAKFAELALRSAWLRISELLEAGALGDPAHGSAPAQAVVEEAVSRAESAATSSSRRRTTAGAGKVAGAVPGPDVHDVEVVIERPETAKVPASLAALRGSDPDAGVLAVAGSWEGARGRSPLVGLLAVGRPDDQWRGVWIEASGLKDKKVAEGLSAALGQGVIGHEVKELMRSLLPLGMDVTGLAMDTAVAGYLLDPSTGDYSLAALRDPGGADGAGVGAAGASTAEGTNTPGKTAAKSAAKPAPAGQLDLDGTGAADPAEPAAKEASLVAQLHPWLAGRLEAEGVQSLHDDVECPLVRVLGRMEVAGIAVDSAELRRIADELTADATRLEAEVQQLAGREFKVNSPTQLRVVLFEELKLTPGRKTKTGYSTDAATLETLRDDHPVVETLLQYREVEKLRSTYGEALLNEVAPDGRIHASFRQTVARTGRLSSERPNLHNIPVRTEAGKRFRRAFVPAEGHSFLVADYDQIELRVLAHLSADPGLVEAFSTGADVHRTVASGVYSVPADEVTHTQRERAKMVSYGLIYGMESFGLARRLSTGVEEAGEIMNRFFKAFPEVQAHMNTVVAEARARGYTRTQFGRTRPLPELNDSNYRLRQQAERQAMNAGIQGLAADLFKIALVSLDRGLEEGGLSSRLVLQVHDEVLVEVAAGEEDRVASLTESAMTGAAKLEVPLVASMAFGSSWAAAKGG